MDRVVAIVLAGGVGERLQPLTRQRSKAAVPFGGKYRIIDFTLSNCVNSGMRQIYVLTQYRSGSLQQHIQDGWGISSAGLGDYIYCVPAQQKRGAEWYRGTADALRQNLDLISDKSIDHVLVLSGDHIYKMDYQQLVSYHKQKGADLTLAAIRVRKAEAARQLGVIEVDPNYRMVGFEEKPARPKTIAQARDQALASMGVYIFKRQALEDIMQGTEDDFGKEVIPKMVAGGRNVFVYDYAQENQIEDYVIEVRDGRRHKVLVGRCRDCAYWRDVGTIDSYYEASIDLVGVDPLFNLYGEKWPFRTFQRPLPPTKFVLGGRSPESILCDGCIVSGGVVWRSILSPGVIVERDAVVEESIIFDDVIVEPGARVRRAIIDKNVRVQAGTSLGHDREADRRRGCTVTDSGITVVPIGADIAP